MSLRSQLPLAVLALACCFGPPSVAQEVYYPGPGDDWQRKRPSEVGIDSRLLDEAIDYAKAHESDAPRDLALNHALTFGREPHGDAIGPFRTRGPLTGVILRHGYLVAEWGEPQRVDMTFSVTKSFLSTTVGLAVERGLIRSVDDRVQPYMPSDLFDLPHNSKITWNHLLRQTSDWRGELWGKPDWADRPPTDLERNRWPHPADQEPGASWEYNDVRVNLLALAALEVWRRPLPQVLKEHVMDPIGASNSWRWRGYENSWVTVDGLKIESVSGGGHWGGGMFLNARDQARFGLFTLRRGLWAGKRLLSESWFEAARTPTKANKGYGFMNFMLNTDQEALPNAPETAYYHSGAGRNVIYVDERNDLVVVVRWLEGGDALEQFIRRVLAALR